ncbi:MAG: TolC family protein [Bacteroidales bacterium]|nr:TolC family protein [Bacteroidales bacterium]
MRKYFTLIIIIFFQTFTYLNILSAQDVWTLEECLYYAEENNIALKRSIIITGKMQSDLRARKYELLPDLRLQSQGSMNFGRSVDPETNTITFNKNITNYYYLGTGVALFNGFAQLNRISAARYLQLSYKQAEEQQKNLLDLDIVNAYYTALMAKGTVKSAAEQVEVSRQQLHKTEVLVETGAESRTTLLEIQSQLSNDRLLLSQAKTNAGIALEDLRLLLQLEPVVPFDIDENTGILIVNTDGRVDADSVYSTSKEILPRIKSLQLRTEARKKELAAAKGLSSPELEAFAGWRTGYYDAMVPGEDPIPFTEQLRNNTNQYVGVSLNIPIFNNWYNQNTVKKAKLDLQDSELELRQEQNALYNEVSKACFELVSVKDEYLSAVDNLEYNKLSFEAVSKKFETGLASATEFAEAKKALFAAEINLLSAELQYKLKEMTVNFYMTGRWERGTMRDER